MSVIDTPNAAKQLALEVAAQCFNDEIRAHVVAELLKHIVPSNTPSIAAARDTVILAAGKLTSAYDRQYRD